MNIKDFNSIVIANYFKQLFDKKDYAFFTNGDYNLNIIGIRTNHQNIVTNQYDDIILVIYKEKGVQNHKMYQMTTEPGKHFMQESLGNTKGTAILVPGQYRSCWTIDKHRNKYYALCQCGKVKVYRDGNFDNVYDLLPEKIDEGYFGINIHRSNEAYTRQTIDMYSAGCQVFNNPKDFKEFMDLCYKQKELYGNKFTYTLINEEDLI